PCLSGRALARRALLLGAAPPDGAPSATSVDGSYSAVNFLTDHQEETMQSARLITAIAALTLALTACGPGIQVRTVASPDAGMGNLRTFRIRPVPERRDGSSQASTAPVTGTSV